MRGTQRGWIGVMVLMVGSAASADDQSDAAERGRQALTGRSFVAAAWKLSSYEKARTQWGPNSPDPSLDRPSYDRAFNARYGLHPAPYPNDGLPMGLRLAPTKDGKGQGLQVDCMVCHGGSIGGTSYVGLGNSQLDSESLFAELTRAEGRPFPQVFTLNTSRGTVNAGQMSAYLLSLRNPDLSWRFIPLKLDAKLPEIDTPAWWILGKKATQYYDGRTDARDSRTNMQFMLGEKTLAQFQELEPTFKDIQAYLKSIKPPKYPFAIDLGKAKRGEVVFTQNCAKCHGSYGENPTYPSEIVPLEIIGTDPARAKGISDKLIAHYNKTWFAEQYKADDEMTGYQAPPLDGIWATAPYFHNGSVPTLHGVLQSSDRPSRFLRPPSTGFENYDTTDVGWKAEAAPDEKTSTINPKQIFDSSRWGLSNKGHTFGDKLSEVQRMDLIEYLKTL